MFLLTSGRVDTHRIDLVSALPQLFGRSGKGGYIFTPFARRLAAGCVYDNTHEGDLPASGSLSASETILS